MDFGLVETAKIRASRDQVQVPPPLPFFNDLAAGCLGGLQRSVNFSCAQPFDQADHDAGFVDVAAADLADALGGPAYDPGDLVVGQAACRQPGDVGSAQVVDGAVEPGGLAALEDGAEAAFGPRLPAAVAQDRAAAVLARVEMGAQIGQDRDHRAALALAGDDDDRLVAHLIPAQPHQIAEAQAGEARQLERVGELRRAHRLAGGDVPRLERLLVARLPHLVGLVGVAKLADLRGDVDREQPALDRPAQHRCDHHRRLVRRARLARPAIAPIEDRAAHPRVGEGRKWRGAEARREPIEPQPVIALGGGGEAGELGPGAVGIDDRVEGFGVA